MKMMNDPAALERNFAAACFRWILELDDDAEPGTVACWCSKHTKCTACRCRERVLKANPNAFAGIVRCDECNSYKHMVTNMNDNGRFVTFCEKCGEKDEPIDTAMERWEEFRELRD